MSQAYLYDHVRTPRGKGRPDGALHEITPVQSKASEIVLPHAQALAHTSKGRRLASDPPAAPAAASVEFRSSTVRLETGATEERVIVSFGSCREAREGLVRCARI
jgi:hypothetical protein